MMIIYTGVSQLKKRRGKLIDLKIENNGICDYCLFSNITCKYCIYTGEKKLSGQQKEGEVYDKIRTHVIRKK